MEREAVLVAIDVGTSKVVVLIGERTADGGLNILGKGAPASSGLKKGVVINIEQTVGSITAAIEQAERTSGYKLEEAWVSVGGREVYSENTHGAVAVSGPRKEVGHDDIVRAMEVARAVNIPSNREILHVLPRTFIVDGQEGVHDPVGMSAVRLEIETHIVHAPATAVQNLTKCVHQAGVRIHDFVAAPLASAEAVLSDTEKDLGVAVADMGAGTTGLALFLEGSPFHTAILPLGGNNVTNDVAIGLKTSLEIAEDLKIRHGTCNLARGGAGGAGDGRDVRRRRGTDRSSGPRSPASSTRACARYSSRSASRSSRAGHGGMLPAGLVLTGGASQLAGVAELGREVLQMPVRVASPAGVGGLTDHLLTPAFSTSIGLLRWASRAIDEDPAHRYESAPAYGGVARLREWVRGLFP